MNIDDYQPGNVIWSRAKYCIISSIYPDYITVDYGLYRCKTEIYPVNLNAEVFNRCEGIVYQPHFFADRNEWLVESLSCYIVRNRIGCYSIKMQNGLTVGNFLHLHVLQNIFNHFSKTPLKFNP